MRGLVYEAAGSLPDAVLAGGVAVVERAAATWSIPVRVLRSDPSSCEAWTRDAGRRRSRRFWRDGADVNGGWVGVGFGPAGGTNVVSTPVWVVEVTFVA